MNTDDTEKDFLGVIRIHYLLSRNTFTIIIEHFADNLRLWAEIKEHPYLSVKGK